MSYNYGGDVVHPYLGRVVLKKLDGGGPVSVGTQVVIPHAAAMPRNPQNISYYTGVNSSAYVSGDNQGKKTPSCTITTVANAAFLTAANLNSLIMYISTGSYSATNDKGNTDTWSILLDDLYNPLVYDGAKCASIQLRQQSTGGPIAISLAFLCQYGDSENDGSLYPLTTFTSSSIEAGQIMDVTQVSWASTADKVQSLDVNLVRPQGYVFYDDGTRYAAGIASGMFGGDLTISQSTKYSTTPTTGFTLNIGTTGNGISCAGLTKLNEYVQDLTMAPRTRVSQYSLYDSTNGGNPFTITAL